MREEDSAELKAFEAALASLVPRADRLDRDRLMFLAGQQSRVGQAERRPTISRNSVIQSGSALRLTHPTWAWPAAFSAMTTVAVVLAVLLAIRPAIPVASPNRFSIASAGNENKGEAAANSQIQPPSVNPPAAKQDFAGQFRSASPWMFFMQSLWNAADPVNAIDSGLPASGATPYSYPQLRDRILRHGLDSWQLAQTIPGNFPVNFHEPSTRREMLKEYLPELQ